ncbi:Glycosyltransferase involved in cell wall bisynthesis [Pseudobutyrivibrio sp. UC1225]|uniref:glycosyltransferase family 2 protein n=1 Tax=Pseudobutyrivibrio sp. UC1225 TaxID=1798185 RepID=UPI0008E3292F|nr:glycosyltransferase family 2 protein [Pseudobutyrivibrio sp. UC1225]SFN78695.1 Glycosyltransferase involved in cell wall bisynthesis [Pseudobutyrivibrio sp. UC1225]
MMKSISVVVPVFNEEGNVAELHREILEVCQKNGYEFEIIFIDDGSSDRTVEICKTLRPLKLIQMRRNFGQTAAMDAGIKEAKNYYVVTMDGDRQNDPADIPMMIKYLEENNLDIVSGWRKNRKDTFMKKFTSRGANFLRHLIIHDGIHDSGCSLKVYKKECFEGINLYGEQHRFIPALLKIKGFTVGEVVVHHRPRTAGKTKYNWKRTIKGFVDMVSVWFWNKFASRPLHLLGGSGMAFIMLGFGCGIWSIVIYASGAKMSTNIIPPLLTIFFVIIGVLLFVFGLMSEIMMKTYYGVHVDRPYNIKNIIENN